MVSAVRHGALLRQVARRWQVSHNTMRLWVSRAGHRRLDRVDLSDRSSGPRHPANRTPRALERRVLDLRRRLKQRSALGECGAAAIAREWKATHRGPIPSLRTIGRILQRWGEVDARLRRRWPAPPRGWSLPPVAEAQAELDSFDTVDDLRLPDGSEARVLNGIGLHGGLCIRWACRQINAKIAVELRLSHWREVGLPAYAKFDNDVLFQGAHHGPDTFSRIVRICLSLGVVPVFAPRRIAARNVEPHCPRERIRAKEQRCRRLCGC